MTQMVAKLDDVGTPIWIALLVLSFAMFWPVGLALRAFLLVSGRFGSGRGRHWGCVGMRRHSHRGASSHRYYAATGNAAFDEYREQTLERLEEEQREFQEFLRRLRMAKDRTEFDRFMATRRAKLDEGSDDDEGSSTENDSLVPDPA